MFSKRIKKELVLEIILFSIGIASISLFYENNILLTVILLIGWLFGIKFWHKKDDIYFFVIGAIGGPIAEVVAINFGAWQYSNPTILGIPIWLPLAWGFAAVMIKRFAEIFVKIESK